MLILVQDMRTGCSITEKHDLFILIFDRSFWTVVIPRLLIFVENESAMFLLSVAAILMLLHTLSLSVHLLDFIFRIKSSSLI